MKNTFNVILTAQIEVESESVDEGIGMIKGSLRIQFPQLRIISVTKQEDQTQK